VTARWRPSADDPQEHMVKGRVGRPGIDAKRALFRREEGIATSRGMSQGNVD
jgi:hypothetical protein